jgi:hypothetical protein
MSPRASTRLKDRPQVSLAETTADRDQEFVQSDALAPIKPTRSKKRKISESANKGKVVGSSKPKKLKGNRGLLRALVEMPLDILLEVCHACNLCSLDKREVPLQKKLSSPPDLCLFATSRLVASRADFKSPASTSHDSVCCVCLEKEFLECA